MQLAHRLDATTVATAAPDRLDVAEEFGADAAVSYVNEDLQRAVSEPMEGGFDVVFDHRPFDYYTFDVETAAFDGTVVLYSGLEGEVELSMAALHNNVTVHAMTMSNLSTRRELPSVTSVLRRVLELTDRGALTPHVSGTYDLSEAAEVHRAVLEDSFVGKLVVTL